ncbi:MAG: TRAP transporter small permease [Dehalobacterium sp.]
MNNLSGKVKGISHLLDKLAGICVFAVMLLIVSNIVFRGVFSKPILGTYELVGFLTALGIALALAYCAFQEGHIAVSFIVERFSKKIQAVINIFINTVAFLFWSTTVWYMGKFAHTMMVKGMVSPSAEIPIYPFIYLVALGLSGLCLVLFYKLLVALKEVVAYAPSVDLSRGLKVSDTVKRGMQ